MTKMYGGGGGSPSPPVVSNCDTFNVQNPGQYSCAENANTIATGYASHAEGDFTRAGLAIQTFTITAGGTLVTIAGDVVSQFQQGGQVRVTPTSLPTITRTVASAPVFAAGSTTFNISSALDLVSVGGEISLQVSVIPQLFLTTLTAGGTVLTTGGDRTANLSVGQYIRLYPLFPYQSGVTYATIAAPAPLFDGVNTIFNLAAPFDNHTTTVSVYSSTGLGLGAHAEGSNTVAEGFASHAEGDRTYASGYCSHAEGMRTQAIGIGSHAEGWADEAYAGGSEAYGGGSHAEGENTVSGNYDSHSEGVGTTAYGFAAHSEGTLTNASGDFSHSEGQGSRSGNVPLPFTIAPGGTVVTIAGNHASEFLNGHLTLPFLRQVPVKLVTVFSNVASVPFFDGVNTTFSISDKLDDTTTGGMVVDSNFGRCAHSEGGTTIATGLHAHSEGVGSLASGYSSHSEGSNTIASGDQSHAEGANTSATGANSHAEGLDSIASGLQSHAEGYLTVASTIYSHAEGDRTQATGTGACHSEGSLSVASGNVSHAEGFNSKATGNASHCEGQNGESRGVISHAEGDTTLASGYASHAEGANTVASSFRSHAEGNFTTASGNASHSEGESNTASGDYSHCEGNLNLASAYVAHCEGSDNVASGVRSHAEGRFCTASAQGSHAQGWGARAIRECDHAEASGFFAAAGDCQHRRTIARGTTLGVTPGETATLLPGVGSEATNALESLKTYLVTIRAVATLMGTGAAVRQTAMWYFTFLASVRSGGTVDLSLVSDIVAPILQGATFIGATLTPSVGGANALTLAMVLSGAVTAQTRCMAQIDYVELLGT